MTTTTTTPTSGAAIQRYKIGYHSDEWGVRSSTPGGITDPSGQWVLYKDHIAALASHGQAPTSSAVLKAIREANMQLVRTGDDAFMLVPYKVATAQAAASVLEDAARYRWIRGPVEESTLYSRWRIEYWDGPNGWQPMQRERMDSAIDAARAAQEGKSHDN